MASEARTAALAELAFCESILAKGGLTVLSDLFRGVDAIEAWSHYPSGDVYDPASQSQWYYHCHPAEEGADEHGHFHCFLRPEGPDGPIHHLLAVGVDASGKLLRLFTVNHWVVDDDWVDGATLRPLLSRFDMQMPAPSYLVNRWLTAIFVAYEAEILDLIEARDRVLAAHVPPEGVEAREDRGLEVLSEYLID